MTLYLLRALFVLLMGSIGYFYLIKTPGPFGQGNWATLGVAVALSLLVLTIDIFSSRRKLLGLSALLFGTLVGMLVAFVLGLAVSWLVDQYIPLPSSPTEQDKLLRAQLVDFAKMLLNIVCCYLMISFIMQTKDDVRFIIPYVEFAKQSRGARPMLLDTSILIDGRIIDLAEVGMVDSRLFVPRFVLEELQLLADSSDRLKRNRGRRGLDVVGKLQKTNKVDVVIYEGASRDADLPVDQQLVALAGELDGRVLTTDMNLNKVAQLRGVTVINLNDLAKAMKPVVLPGEQISVQLIKPGEQPGQAVGFLEDGTMVVVEQARQHIGQADVQATVTSVMQTSAGRMIFGRVGENGLTVRQRSQEVS